MRTLRALMLRMTCWLTRQRDEERLAAELEEHLALQTAENVSAGMDEAEARRRAAVKLEASRPFVKATGTRRAGRGAKRCCKTYGCRSDA